MHKDKTRKKNRETMNIKFSLCCGDTENVLFHGLASHRPNPVYHFFLYSL